MSLNHKEINELQFSIREILGRPDVENEWWEITDYILDNYFLTKKPVSDEDNPEDHITHAQALERISEAFSGLSKDLLKFCGVTGEEK